MCGIAGIVGRIHDAALDSMLDALIPRGPDDAGTFREEAVQLGMRRLAVIDTSSLGHQPMSNAEKTIWIVYNGEVYNFREERRWLEQNGHIFVSNSDTEVILKSYEARGKSFLKRLRGMFALAIYDRRPGPGRECLLLARDHLGVKPLLYSNKSARFVFASEIKALLASGLVSGELDPESIRHLVTTGAVIQPRSILRDVQMLPAGHVMTIRTKDASNVLEPFWNLEQNRRPELQKASYPELVQATRDALEESVKLQMISDVPLGAFLSGGVDSSLLTGLMMQHAKKPLRTFSVGFEGEGADIDESEDALRSARFIGSIHTPVLVTGNEVSQSIEAIARSLDQPSVDGVNSYFISQAARKQVTVAISGTGGDELFAGYPWFIDMAVFSEQLSQRSGPAFALKKSVSRILRTDFARGLRHVSDATAFDSYRSRLDFLARFARNYLIFDPIAASRVLSADIRRRSLAGREPANDLTAHDELRGATPVERVSALVIRGYLKNQLLRDIDAVSMAHSLEVRVPFLDIPLVDLALSLPSNAKLGDVTGLRDRANPSYRTAGIKRILIDAGRDVLPPDLDLQVKRGFAMPFNSWLRGPLKEVLQDSLDSRVVRARGIFDAAETSKVLENFFEGNCHWSRPWILMMTELWCRGALDY